MNYVLVNDKDIYNGRYRGPLIECLEKSGATYQSIGLFDGFGSFLMFIAKSCGSSTIISSNLKSNIIFMVFFWKSGVVILNGLGRYKRQPAIRKLIVFLIWINQRKALCVQNYLDYRYFRRYLSNNNLVWVPGSGGKKRSFGSNDADSIVVVSRDSKISLVSESISDYAALIPLKVVKLVGCSESSFRDCGFDRSRVFCVGYVKQDNLFDNGGTFFQPSGYGEGIPHSLVDALISGMPVVLHIRQIIEYGFYKFNWTYERNGNPYVLLDYSINDYEQICESAIKAQFNELLGFAV